MLTYTEFEGKKLQVNHGEKLQFLWFLPFFLSALFPLFWQLNATPVILWDEARLAMNAAEMLENGELFITYYNGELELWNTKPPLQVWLIALSIKIFGYNELALRLPSAIEGAITIFIVFIFGLKVLKSNWVGIISMLVLATTQGYVGFHVTRSGDYDALLVLFTTAYSLLYFTYLEQPKRWYLIAFGILLGLAVLAKSVAGLLCLPALLLYTLSQRKLLFVLKQRELYLAMLIFFLIICSFYLTREMLLPGYLKSVYENELGGRYLETLENHKYPASFFLKNLLEWRLVPWVFILPLALLILFWQPQNLYRRFALFGTLFFVTFLAIISSSQTKLDWYDASIFPITALLAGLGLTLILVAVVQTFKFKIHQQNWFFAICIILIFWQPYRLELLSLLKLKVEAPEKYSESYYDFALKEYAKQEPEQKELTLLISPGLYKPSLLFYKKGFEKKGYNFREKGDDLLLALHPNEIVITCEANFRDQVKENYEVSQMYSQSSCGVFKIIRKKQQVVK